MPNQRKKRTAHITSNYSPWQQFWAESERLAKLAAERRAARDAELQAERKMAA